MRSAGTASILDRGSREMPSGAGLDDSHRNRATSIITKAVLYYHIRHALPGRGGLIIVTTALPIQPAVARPLNLAVTLMKVSRAFYGSRSTGSP